MGHKQHRGTRLGRWGHLRRLLLRWLHDGRPCGPFLQGLQFLPLALQFSKHLRHFGVETCQGIGRGLGLLRGFGLGRGIGGGLAHPRRPRRAVDIRHLKGPGFGHEQPDSPADEGGERDEEEQHDAAHAQPGDRQPGIARREGPGRWGWRRCQGSHRVPRWRATAMAGARRSRTAAAKPSVKPPLTKHPA
jgi:hypothetical protein